MKRTPFLRPATKLKIGEVTIEPSAECIDYSMRYGLPTLDPIVVTTNRSGELSREDTAKVAEAYFIQEDTLFLVCKKNEQVVVGLLPIGSTLLACGDIDQLAIERKMASVSSVSPEDMIIRLQQENGSKYLNESSIAFGYDPAVLGHVSTNDRIHEGPIRVRRSYEAIESHPFFKSFFPSTSSAGEKNINTNTGPIIHVPPRLATPQEIYRVHDKGLYKDFIESGGATAQIDSSDKTTGNEVNLLSSTHPTEFVATILKNPISTNTIGDVYCSGDGSSHKAVMMSCGITIDAAKLVTSSCEGGPSPDSAFCLIRPPGHHCTHDKPNGFCLVNNVVIAVRALQEERRMTGPPLRIAIVDCDVHHGDGTQSLIKDDPNVMFFSTHRFDGGSFFPYGDAGRLVVRGDSSAYIINIPFDTAAYDPQNCHKVISDYAYSYAAKLILSPALHDFKPDVVFISCGFDALYGDPLGKMAVTINGYRNVVLAVQQYADKYRSECIGVAHQRDNSKCGIITVLEGGYNPEAVSKGVLAVFSTLLLGKSGSEKCVSLSSDVSYFINSTTGDDTYFSYVIPQTWSALRKKQMAQYTHYLTYKKEREYEDRAKESVSEQPEGVDTRPALLEPVQVPDDDVLISRHKLWVEEIVSSVVKEARL